MYIHQTGITKSPMRNLHVWNITEHHIEQFSSGSELLLPRIVLLPITRGQYTSIALETLSLHLKISKVKRCL